MNADFTSLQHQGFIDSLAMVAEAVPGGSVTRHGGVVAAVSGSPIPLFNPVFIERDDATDQQFEAALKSIGDAGIRGSVFLRVGTDDRFVATVEASDLEEVEEPPMPGMVLQPIPDHQMPPDLEIRSNHAGAIGDHKAVVAEAFGMPIDLVDTFLVPALLANPAVTTYAGYLDNEPVAAAIGIEIGSILEVVNVATLTEARSRGYGAAMTMRAVLDGKAKGCAVAVLQSTPIGLSVYRGLGFETVVEYRQWVTPIPE
jgi:ribosomal protein S18 acetylase RimI-like enzyme